jgi:hypothetical protein
VNDGWMHEGVNEQTCGCSNVDGRTDGYTDVWGEGWLKGQTC